MAIKKEPVKKILTKDLSGKENGLILELFKNNDRVKTDVYLTCIKQGTFKGYHLHKVRTGRYYCIKGKVKVILYFGKEREEVILSAETPERLILPINTPNAIENIGDGDAHIINYPDPPYDPTLKGEQLDFTQKQIDNNEHMNI